VEDHQDRAAAEAEEKGLHDSQQLPAHLTAADAGKALESLVAERIAYLVEEYGLLPKIHFGARKQRSTTHAMSYLCEDVFKTWHGKTTLSLVSFNVKGAYNNMATEPELRRLQQQQLPEKIV
jgi:hypothetical protein